jgi:hypothetical protein
MKIQFSEPVHDVLAHICQKASLDPCGYSLYLRKPTQQGIQFSLELCLRYFVPQEAEATKTFS